ALAVEDVDGDEDHAELHAGEEEIDHLDRVRQVDAEPIAFGAATGEERVCDAVAAHFELAEGVRPPLPLERRGIGTPLQGEIEKLEKIHTGASISTPECVREHRGLSVRTLPWPHEKNPALRPDAPLRNSSRRR